MLLQVKYHWQVQCDAMRRGPVQSQDPQNTTPSKLNRIIDGNKLQHHLCLYPDICKPQLRVLPNQPNYFVCSLLTCYTGNSRFISLHSLCFSYLSFLSIPSFPNLLCSSLRWQGCWSYGHSFIHTHSNHSPPPNFSKQ
jgi:hypothetical protein